MYTVTTLDNEIINSLVTTINILKSTSFKNKEDKQFINKLNAMSSSEQCAFIYNIVSGGYSSIQTFIEKEETVSVPFLGMFKYIEGKKIKKETTLEVLKENGYSAFKDILDENVKLELSSQIHTKTYSKIIDKSIYKTSKGKSSNVLPFTLKLNAGR